MTAWTIQKSPFFAGRWERYEKNHPAECIAMMDNLDRFLVALNSGVPLLQIRGGFIHQEPAGIKALDQPGGQGKLKQSRLYVYPDGKRRTLHVISVGDKSSQKRDIQEARDYVRPL